MRGELTAKNAKVGKKKRKGYHDDTTIGINFHLTLFEERRGQPFVVSPERFVDSDRPTKFFDMLRPEGESLEAGQYEREEGQENEQAET